MTAYVAVVETIAVNVVFSTLKYPAPVRGLLVCSSSAASRTFHNIVNISKVFETNYLIRWGLRLRLTDSNSIIIPK